MLQLTGDGDVSCVVVDADSGACGVRLSYVLLVHTLQRRHAHLGKSELLWLVRQERNHPQRRRTKQSKWASLLL